MHSCSQEWLVISSCLDLYCPAWNMYISVWPKCLTIKKMNLLGVLASGMGRSGCVRVTPFLAQSPLWAYFVWLTFKDPTIYRKTLLKQLRFFVKLFMFSSCLQFTLNHCWFPWFWYVLCHAYRLLDIVNIMTYDLHGHWDAQTGHQAALYPNNENWPYYSVVRF